jgi:hypothetical protein
MDPLTLAALLIGAGLLLLCIAVWLHWREGGR